jgi:HPt (histidine-containing phosphotransfer) domain-containing protein
MKKTAAWKEKGFAATESGRGIMERNKMIEAGIDYDEGVERFGGSPALFEKYLQKFFADDFLSPIERQLQSGDIAGAFRTTHDLKGVSGNLSLNQFYEAVCELTEQLRDGAPGRNYDTAFQQAKMWYERAKKAVMEEKQ